MTVLVQAIARLLLAPSLVVAAALIVKGYSDVGEGFSAGVVVALAVALQYIALGPRGAEDAFPLLRFAPVLAVSGLLVALAASFFPLTLGRPPFSHLPAAGTHPVTIGTLELVTAVVLDLGIFLLVVGVLIVLLHQMASAEEAPSE